MANEEKKAQGVRRQQVLPTALKDVIADLIYVWLHNDGWLQDGDADTVRARAARKDESMKALVKWAVDEGIVDLEEVIPF